MLIGIDVGATKTHVVGVDDAAPFDLVIPTVAWQQHDLVGAPATVPRLLAALPRASGVEEAPLAVGAHGLDSAWQIDAFTDALRQHRGGPSVAVNDVELLVPAAGLEQGVAVVVGTGSKVVGHDAGGEVIAAGGYGFLLGDPGSAPALAFSAAKAALAAHDEGDDADPLVVALMAAIDARDALGIAHVFSYDIDIHRWGSLAPLVFRAADAGSPYAVAVIDRAAADLALDVERVLRRGAVGVDVVCAGGVVAGQPRLLGALTARLRAVRPDLHVRLLEVPPVHGAVELARRLSSSTATTPSL